MSRTRNSIRALAAVLLASAPAFALTPAQCEHFAVDGHTTICHATGDPSNPFVPVNPSTVGCSRGHSTHHTDYVAVGDPNCTGGGCLAESAPCDATLPCCSGTCTGGVCVASCGAQGAACTANADCCSGNCCTAGTPPTCDGCPPGTL